jgi:hypothetical protein
MEAARTLKANMKLDGKPCGWCLAALRLGDGAAVCTACDKEHHGTCWESHAGCATAGCLNAPLRRLDAAVQAGSPVQMLAQALPAGYMSCPHCRIAIVLGTAVCPACRAIASPDGIYHGPKTNAPGAVSSMVWGLVGLMLCGIVVGPLAISKANAATRAMASDPTLGGDGYATAGKVLGVIDIIVFVLFAISKISGPTR